MIDSLIAFVYKQFKFPEKQDTVTLAVQIYSTINFTLKFAGLNIYSENFNLFNPILMCALFDCVTYIMINVNTMVLYWGDLLKVSFCLATLGCGFQGSIKAYTCLFRIKAIKKLYRDSLDMISEPDNEAVKNAQLMYLRWTYISVKAVSGIAVFSGIFILAQPMLEAIITSKRILPFGFILPWLEPYGNPGYYLNWAHHALQTYLTISVLLGTLVANINLLIHGYSQINCLVLMLDRLNELCSEAKDARKHKEIGEYLNKIIAFHQKNVSFLNEFNDIFSLHALINIMSIVFQITVTMVAVVSYTTWLIGYVILAMALMQLFFECFLGTVLYEYSDLLMKKIYDIAWHEMTIRNQNSLILLLHAAQDPKMLSFQFGSVDMNLFVEVLKKVYSVFMMLQNFK